MTVMAGATISPSLPGIKEVYAAHPQADILAKLILTLPALFIALFAPLSGYVIDQFGRKRLMVGSLLLYAVAGTSGYYLDGLYAILAGRALLGMAVAGVMTTATTLVGDYFEGEERSRFLGNQAAFMALGGAVFVTSGGYLADLNWRYPFLIYASALLLAPLAWRVLYEPTRARPLPRSQASPQASYPRYTVAVVYLLGFIGMATFYMIPVQIPFLLEGFPRVSQTLVGVAISVATVMAALASGNFRLWRRHLTFIQIYAFSFVTMALSFLFISQARYYLEVVGGLAVGGFGAGLLLPNSNLWVISLAPTALRGRLVGGITTAIFLGQFFSPILIEPLRQATSLGVAFAATSLLMALVGAVLGIYSLIKLSRPPAAPHREEAATARESAP